MSKFCSSSARDDSVCNVESVVSQTNGCSSSLHGGSEWCNSWPSYNISTQDYFVHRNTLSRCHPPPPPHHHTFPHLLLIHTQARARTHAHTTPTHRHTHARTHARTHALTHACTHACTIQRPHYCTCVGSMSACTHAHSRACLDK